MTISCEIRGLSVRLGGNRVISDFSFQVSNGEVIAIMGRSGVGKTTLLKGIGGLLRSGVSGTVSWSVDAIEQRSYRPLGLVQQDSALAPWFTANGYMRMCAAARRLDARTTRKLAENLFEAVGLDPRRDGHKTASQLSGGMATRVILAGAIATGTKVFMFDEPFARLDDPRRYELLDLTKSILAERAAVGIIVTHSTLEAAYLSDRIVVLESPAMGKYQIVAGLRKLTAGALEVDAQHVGSIRTKINSMLAL